MRSIYLYISCSLDGYIAEEDGSADFLVGDGSDPGYRGSYLYYYDTLDTILIGRNTYENIRKMSPDVWPYHGKQTYVFTHQPYKNTEDILFTDEEPAALTASLRAMPGKNICVFGGADLVRQMMDLDLIDRYYISVVPAIVGHGIPLFREGQTPRRLRLIKTESYNGITDLVYEPVRFPHFAEDADESL